MALNHSATVRVGREELVDIVAGWMGKVGLEGWMGMVIGVEWVYGNWCGMHWEYALGDGIWEVCYIVKIPLGE